MAKKKSDAAPPANATKKANELLDAMTEQLVPARPYDCLRGEKLGDVPAGKTILAQDCETQIVIFGAVLDRLETLESKLAAVRSDKEEYKIAQRSEALVMALEGLLRRALQLDEATVTRLLQWSIRAEDIFYTDVLSELALAVENFAKSNEIRDSLRTVLETVIGCLRQDPREKEWRKIAGRLAKLLPDGAPVAIEAGEAWSDVALADLKNMKGTAGKSWYTLLEHCRSGSKSKPTERWATEARRLVDAVGFVSFKKHALRWFPLVDKPRTDSLEDRKPWMKSYEWHHHVGSIHEIQHFMLPVHVEMLRGLAWCAGLREDADLARALTHLAISAYRKLPGVGPRLVSLGNACVTALSMMPGLPTIGQLAILKTKIKSGPAQKEIEKAFNAAAKRENLPRDDIEELAVPSYGLEEVGHLRQSFGEYQAELTVDGSSAALHWIKQNKPIKSVPAAMKKEHAAELKELQATVKDINSMLPAQRERLDTLFLSQKTWPLSVWRERYLDHPLIGTIARRLIWSFAAKGRISDGIWHKDDLLGIKGKPLKLKGDVTVSLWHPIGHAMEEVLAWREWLERREVIQPFKQAHREVYLLTDAERRTRTYSNRFASHILRQHQFHALCGARGWKDKLRLVYEGIYPPAQRLLPAWGLRAEYWVEGVGDQYGRDTNESGVQRYLTTDQVRFYALDEQHEPLPLETIPPLVFSETLRDIDLFVGVASVGNDPEWFDGGPDGRYRDYWHSYSFGELSATAQTRRAFLERLLPRLKIADRCTLSERFLVVRGDLRTYKIHLGSGNILMTPNDQYLCIVPKQATAGSERVFLPFEGDGTLSVILSKAFLLAQDAKITDPSITSQIERT